MTMENETVDAYFDNLGDRLTYVHLSDGPGQHLYPGNGSYDLDGFLERLRVNGYQGVIALEIKDPPAFTGPTRRRIGVSNGWKAWLVAADC